jgi:mono/diheme cytochrome c family protein
MSLLSRTTVLGAVLTFAVSASAQDQDRDIGKIEYQSNCASCHGIDAKGHGPVSGELKKRPPDLTVLAKKNGGVFPLNFVYRIIDGRDEIASHGSREMPVWGYRFVPPKHFDLKLGDDYIYLPPSPPGPIVHARILAVIDYLNRVQEK